MLVEYDDYDGEDGMAEHRQQDGSVDSALDEPENQRPSAFHSFIYALEPGAGGKQKKRGVMVWSVPPRFGAMGQPEGIGRPSVMVPGAVLLGRAGYSLYRHDLRDGCLCRDTRYK